MEKTNIESMEQSTTLKCACKGPNPGYEIIADECIEDELRSLKPSSHWELSLDRKSISRSFTCRNWQAAIKAIEAISTIAESDGMNHHPDLHLTNYRELKIVIQTHSIGGLTNFDFRLASEIDGVEFDYSPKWLRAHSLS